MAFPVVRRRWMRARAGGWICEWVMQCGVGPRDRAVPACIANTADDRKRSTPTVSGRGSSPPTAVVAGKSEQLRRHGLDLGPEVTLELADRAGRTVMRSMSSAAISPRTPCSCGSTRSRRWS